MPDLTNWLRRAFAAGIPTGSTPDLTELSTRLATGPDPEVVPALEQGLAKGEALAQDIAMASGGLALTPRNFSKLAQRVADMRAAVPSNIPPEAADAWAFMAAKYPRLTGQVSKFDLNPTLLYRALNTLFGGGAAKASYSTAKNKVLLFPTRHADASAASLVESLAHEIYHGRQNAKGLLDPAGNISTSLDAWRADPIEQAAERAASTAGGAYDYFTYLRNHFANATAKK